LIIDDFLLQEVVQVLEENVISLVTGLMSKMNEAEFRS
jgi:hypothetical protein